MIDSENREEFFGLKPNGKVFQCIAMDERTRHIEVRRKIISGKS